MLLSIITNFFFLCSFTQMFFEYPKIFIPAESTYFIYIRLKDTVDSKLGTIAKIIWRTFRGQCVTPTINQKVFERDWNKIWSCYGKLSQTEKLSTLYKIWENTGFLWPVFPYKYRIHNSAITRENIGHRKPVFWHILHSIKLNQK